jgi:predicted metal-dependent hydrolase
MPDSNPPLPVRLPPQALAGCACFDDHEYFAAHEHLEAAWRAESGPVRELYRGILLVAVGYYHMQRSNYTGARKVFARARACFAPFPDVCLEIDLARLKADFDAAEAAIDHLCTQIPAGQQPYPFKPIPWIEKP